MAIMWITSTTATATSSTAITSTSTDQTLADRAGNTWTGGSIGLLAARGYTDVTVMLLAIVSAISASLSPSGKAVQDKDTASSDCRSGQAPGDHPPWVRRSREAGVTLTQYEQSAQRLAVCLDIRPRPAGGRLRLQR